MTYELVLDNSKMLANCFEEAPLESFTVDLPAWHCSDTGGGGDYDALSTTDTSSEMVLSYAYHLGIGYFAETDQGAIVEDYWVYMPDVPDGYVLSRATYVVIAYRNADDGTYTGSPISNYEPATNIASPYLNAENGFTIENYAITPLPVGGYSGETEWSGDEILSRITNPPGTSGSQKPCLRLWHEESTTYNPTNDIHIAYFALRLYYSPA